MTPKDDEGSIVIEAMVAALIVAAMAAALFQTVAADARADRLAGTRRRALLVAQSQLAAAPAVEGVREGRDGDLVWRTVGEPYESEDGASDVDPVSRVTVTVRAADGGAALARLSTLRLGG